jgi:hypothetical protein
VALLFCCSDRSTEAVLGQRLTVITPLVMDGIESGSAATLPLTGKDQNSRTASSGIRGVAVLGIMMAYRIDTPS